ncbi:DUF4169 family protein [Robiginitomaculum antarcticum]|uniref:DUF4169 family protein n=1 Tax=Robiginitomaculum antarcticum TaxID=437507 RepID=UPI0003672DE9|nr:DUF4169 family protein [Robiginitomaculum antarcticum]
MSGAPINLNKARKAKAKVDKTVSASANRAKFGRSKAQKVLDKTRAEKAASKMDGHRRNNDPH